MERDEILNKIKSGSPTVQQITSWIQSMPSTIPPGKIVPATIEVGDVFMHRIFGHPYVILKKTGNGEGFICTLLTTDEECKEILCRCESRLFNKGFFTKALFTTTIPMGAFVGCFLNDKQLNEVYKLLKKSF